MAQIERNSQTLPPRRRKSSASMNSKPLPIHYSGEEILACDKAGIAITLPKPMTSGIEAKGRFGKQDFVYLSDEDAYRCPAGEKLKYYYTNEENGQKLRRYWKNAPL